MNHKIRLTNHEPRTKPGSALILAVVLTALLAIIGTVFLMVARIDKIATSAVTENKELEFAVDTVVAKISQQLALDVPGNDLNQEYYDYPDPCNDFLASLEPYQFDANDYRWRQVSDVTGFIERAIPGVKASWDTQDIEITNSAPYLFKAIVEDHKKIELDNNGNLLEQLADADGDGIADSKWIQLDDITSNKGKPIYAAIRIIDNGGMLNVNTAYKFDPNVPGVTTAEVDGSKVTQINLLSFYKGNIDDSNNLHRVRCDGQEPDLVTFNDECAIRIENPDRTNINYLPYDISDELELRNRFILDIYGNTCRIEAAMPKTLPYYLGNPYRHRFAPIDTTPDFLDWKELMNPFDPDEDYNFRHLLTTYNMDRIINPVGGKMLNVNRINPNEPNIVDLYNFIRLGFADAGFADDSVAAQLAVNIKDFSDSDAIVSSLMDSGGLIHYGFEAQPFISEIGIKIDANAPDNPANNHYAVELYNPFNISIPLDGFTLSLSNGTDILLSGAIGPNDFFVVLDSAADFSNPPNSYEYAALQLSGNYNDTTVPPDGIFDSWENYNIALKRTVDGTDIYLDNQPTDPCWFAQGTVKYVQRDDTNWHIVYEDDYDPNDPAGTLGSINSHISGQRNYNLALANHDFITIGDIALPLKIGSNTTPDGTIGRQLKAATAEADIRINLADPAYHYQHIFNYLTVMDPTDYILDPTETRIKGRININTAPWFVIAQLPWVSPQLAHAIVAYRDKTAISGGPDYTLRIGTAGFESIGQLNNVIDANNPNYSIDYYARDPGDQPGFPDLTGGDGAPDDFEERDLIFSRISNLVTVRSDVFTAYILVRIGVDGPQKRVIAILDRSKVSDVNNGKVKVIALHPVPDPR